MTRLSGKQLVKEKQNIKNRYISGDSVISIAQSYSCLPRNIYFHLGDLTAEEKGLHAKNMSLKNSVIKLRKEKHVQKSRREKANSGLADFKQ